VDAGIGALDAGEPALDAASLVLTEPDEPTIPAARVLHAAEERPRPTHTSDLPAKCLPGEGRRVETTDLDGDGKPDVHKLFVRAPPGSAVAEYLACKRMDMNRDGSEEYVATYDEHGALATEHYDFTFDGLFDLFKLHDPSTGRLIESGRDTDSDGLYDLFELYDDEGQLALVTRDRNGDGSADRWEVYKSGALVETQVDDDFDGRVDTEEK